LAHPLSEMCTQLNQVSLLLGSVSSKSPCNFVVHFYHAFIIVNKITNTEHKYTKCIQYYNPPITDTQQCTQTYSTASIIQTN